MIFGPELPKQDPLKVLLLAEKWQRAPYAQQRWAEPTKKSLGFLRRPAIHPAAARSAGKSARPLKPNGLQFRHAAAFSSISISRVTAFWPDPTFTPSPMSTAYVNANGGTYP